MARPEKNNCDYFSHDNGMRNHRKVKAVRTKFPDMIGYGLWSMFLEYLTDSEWHQFNPTDLEYELISGDFGVSVAVMKEFVSYCVQIELLYEVDNKIISKTLIERLQSVHDRREKERERERTKKIPADNNPTQPKFPASGIPKTETPPKLPVKENPQIKGNESILNDTKLNINGNDSGDSASVGGDLEKDKSVPPSDPTPPPPVDPPPVEKIKEYEPRVHKMFKWVNEACTRVQKMKKPLTIENCNTLLKKFPPGLVKVKIEAMENHAELYKKYIDANLTLQDWCRMAVQRGDPAALLKVSAKEAFVKPSQTEFFRPNGPEKENI